MGVRRWLRCICLVWLHFERLLTFVWSKVVLSNSVDFWDVRRNGWEVWVHKMSSIIYYATMSMYQTNNNNMRTMNIRVRLGGPHYDFHKRYWSSTWIHSFNEVKGGNLIFRETADTLFNYSISRFLGEPNQRPVFMMGLCEQAGISRLVYRLVGKKVQNVDFFIWKERIGFGPSVKNSCCSIPSIFVKQILNMGSPFVRNQATRRWGECSSYTRAGRQHILQILVQHKSASATWYWCWNIKCCTKNKLCFISYCSNVSSYDIRWKLIEAVEMRLVVHVARLQRVFALPPLFCHI